MVSVGKNAIHPRKRAFIIRVTTGMVVLILTSTTSSLADEKPATRDFAVTGFPSLKRWAEVLSHSDYQPSPPLPKGIDNLSYDDYRMIAFRHRRAIWFNKPKAFWSEMFHRGFVHRDKVDIHLISKDREYHVPFMTSVFEYRGPLSELDLPEDTGYAGLRVVGSFPGREDRQEMLTFLGASYFRALVNNGVYGASSRGIAVNIGTTGKEEFPAFREFWIIEPKPDDEHLEILALLDGPSLCGAYQFIFRPRINQSEIDVRATLFFREKIQKLGVAPLTSMWMWGDGIDPPPKDHRPEVHDSDGLLIQTKDDWIYRALSRQSYPSLSRFEATPVEGFGLMQRETNYARYQDNEAKYHLRPSLWIKPRKPFKNGRIELIELPGVHEGIDNIAAYWVPANPVELETPLELDYRVSYFRGAHPEHSRFGKATSTEIDHRNDKTLQFRVTFEGEALSQLAPETPLTVNVSSVRARVVDSQVIIQPDGSRIAQIFVEPEGDGPVEIQARLMDANRKVTETWSYLCALTQPKYKFPQVYTRIE